MSAEHGLTNTERLAEIERNTKHLASMPLVPTKRWLRDLYVSNINEQVEALRKMSVRNAKAGATRKAARAESEAINAANL